MSIEKEYQEFREARPEPVANAAREGVLLQVRRDLHPPLSWIFAKLAGIQALSAIASLGICPQFGIRWGGTGMGLMETFMQLGSTGCTIACGAFFTALSLLLAAIFLRPEELRALRSSWPAQLVLLSALSLGLFWMASPERIFASVAMLWLGGAVLGGALALELGFRARIAWEIRH